MRCYTEAALGLLRRRNVNSPGEKFRCHSHSVVRQPCRPRCAAAGRGGAGRGGAGRCRRCVSVRARGRWRGCRCAPPRSGRGVRLGARAGPRFRRGRCEEGSGEGSSAGSSGKSSPGSSQGWRSPVGAEGKATTKTVTRRAGFARGRRARRSARRPRAVPVHGCRRDGSARAGPPGAGRRQGFRAARRTAVVTSAGTRAVLASAAKDGTAGGGSAGASPMSARITAGW